MVRLALFALLVLLCAVSARAAEVDAGEQAALGCAARHRVVHGAPLAVPRSRLAPVGAEEGSVFRAAYELARGSGTLTRAPLVRDGDGALRLLPPLWDAAALLARRNPATRRIHTFDGLRTIPFTWESLPAALQEGLSAPPLSAGPDGVVPPDAPGPARLAWLRGERRLEGRGLRVRAGLLGDAVHGAPVFAGAAMNPPSRAGDETYAAFREAASRRPPAVYLGANDGMLHAFDARSGVEMFTYVPALLADALGALTAPGYVHRPYVDGPLALGEASIGDRWRTVLVASPGMGARGLFALDVTDPADFAGALWEFGAATDAAIGNVLAPAQVARLQVRTRDGVPQYRHFALAGNGVGTGAAALFLLALDKAPTQPWRRDTSYYRLDLPPGEPGLATGLSAPALVPDEEDVVRHAYAGDLQGNLWRFDFTRPAPWRTGVPASPVFVARDGEGTRQPIVQQPKVVHAAGGGYLVLFGTGQLQSRADRDPARFAPQSFYAVYDDPGAPRPASPLTRADLLERRVYPATDADAGFVVTGRNQAVGAGERPKGWYVDFPGSATMGERSVASAAVVDGNVAFHTVLPGPDRCADSASRAYLLDALSGLAPGDGTPAASGNVTGMLLADFVDGAPVVLAAARTRVPSAAGTRGRVTRVKDHVAFGAGGGVTRAGTSRAALPAGRLSWREVMNWRQLHNAAARRPAR
ncbi:pilus assembly protein [Pseudoduganella chitinolytica]|uniref:PilC/PilY family type IV pilus protein n=1 Tax=Pseudoduganella chitinolytica TaxID=34070 RepID=A0ABY8BKS6_9BURK|nr:PilC/PilY family type IV pilus protein [Pseudoduganella chitinolytica]WEF35511.1 PilC/PilY family type IV pilus protein [Pseudoduganella chitinolytica]